MKMLISKKLYILKETAQGKGGRPCTVHIITILTGSSPNAC